MTTMLHCGKKKKKKGRGYIALAVIKLCWRIVAARLPYSAMIFPLDGAHVSSLEWIGYLLGQLSLAVFDALYMYVILSLVGYISLFLVPRK